MAVISPSSSFGKSAALKPTDHLFNADVELLAVQPDPVTSRRNAQDLRLTIVCNCPSPSQIFRHRPDLSKSIISAEASLEDFLNDYCG
jgi:hypothetical protein